MRIIMVFVVAIFAAHVGVHANDLLSEGTFRVDVSRQGWMSISEGGRSRQVRLTHDVFGYEVNCRKTLVLSWGKPKVLNGNNPQDSVLTIFNLKFRDKPIVIGFGKNIFDAVFLDDGVTAIIESDLEVLVDAARGILLSPVIMHP